MPNPVLSLQLSQPELTSRGQRILHDLASDAFASSDTPWWDNTQLELRTAATETEVWRHREYIRRDSAPVSFLQLDPFFIRKLLESDLRYTTSLLLLASVDIPRPEHIMACLEQDRSQIQDFVTQTQDSFDDDASWDGVMEYTIPFNDDLDNTARQGAPTLPNGSVASLDSACPASAPGCDTPAVGRSVLQPGVGQDVQVPTPSLLPANPDSPAVVTGDNLTICYAMIPGQTASISSGDGSDSTGQSSGSEASTSCEQSVVRRSPQCRGPGSGRSPTTCGPFPWLDP